MIHVEIDRGYRVHLHPDDPGRKMEMSDIILLAAHNHRLSSRVDVNLNQ